MNHSVDITPAPLSLVPQESLSYDDIAPLELLRITSSTFTKLVLDGDDYKDPLKLPTVSMSPSNSPTKFDVLLGREKESLNHVGNKRFRVMVALHRNQYQSSTTRVAKTCITTKLINDIHDCGGRFLKKNEITGEYEEVNHKEAHEKVSHALRQAKDPSAKKAPRKPRKVVRKPPTPQENKAFDFMFVEQQRIFQELLAEQYAIGATTSS
jgi:hypothetical protein